MAARCSKFFGIMIVELEVKKTESASVNDREELKESEKLNLQFQMLTVNT